MPNVQESVPVGSETREPVDDRKNTAGVANRDRGPMRCLGTAHVYLTWIGTTRPFIQRKMIVFPHWWQVAMSCLLS